MAVTYRATLRTARMTAVLDDINSGSGAGKLKIGTSGMGTVLATITLDDPAGTVSGDVLTISTPRSDTSADATGTAAAAIITNSDDTTIVSGLTVGTSGTDIVVDSTSITSGQTVTLSSATLTHPS